MTPTFADDWLTVYQGDCRVVLQQLAAESVNCVVTSPPYWGLRDYGVAGQLGLEPSPTEYVEQLVCVFREVRRVLRKDGTLWLNLGDTFAASRSGPVGDHSTLDGGGAEHGRHYREALAASRWSDRRHTRERFPELGIKPKDLIGIPWRVAFALQADGWYLRRDIIWSKPNPMPESVLDRPTTAHEYLFLLAKSERYHYDAESIREAGTTTDPRLLTFGERPDLGYPGHSNDRRRAKSPAGWDRGDGRHDGVPTGRYAEPNGDVHSPYGQGFTRRSGNKDRKPRPGLAGDSRHQQGNVPWEGNTRNRRSVWTVATQPYPGAHFATFPPKLVEPCILAGCPEGGVVLDCFAGTGTVGLVAANLSRRAVLIDLNADYLLQALHRNRNVPLGLVEAAS